MKSHSIKSLSQKKFIFEKFIFKKFIFEQFIFEQLIFEKFIELNEAYSKHLARSLNTSLSYIPFRFLTPYVTSLCCYTELARYTTIQNVYFHTAKNSE
jgi:ABC-type multidrug transport system permease subunit